MSEQKSLLDMILNAIGFKSGCKNLWKPGKRHLHLETLEDRQLLSVTTWGDDHYGSPYYDDIGQFDDVNNALFFDEDTCPDEVEIPPDIMDFSYSDGRSGPLTFEEFCIATAQDFLLSTWSPTTRSPTMWSQNSTSGFSLSGFNIQGPMQTMSSGTSDGNPRGGNTQYDAVFVVDTLQNTSNPTDGLL